MAKDVEIPSKDAFRIGEVAKLLGLEAYVLRYWETEFAELKPKKTRSGQRTYAREDVELLLRIQDLLHHELYTIAGAKRQMELERKGVVPPSAAELELVQGKLDAALAQCSVLDVQAKEAQQAQAHAQEQLAQILEKAQDLEAQLAAQSEQSSVVDEGWDVLSQESQQAHEALQARFDALQTQYNDLVEAHELLSHQHDVLSAQRTEVNARAARERQKVVASQDSLREQLHALIHLVQPAA